MQREEALKWIRGLTDKQLTEFFYEAVEGRKVIKEGEDYFSEHLVLTNAVSSRQWLDSTAAEKTFGNWSPWELRVIALHNKDIYEGGWDDHAGICQYGECVCGHQVASWAKQAICPVCDAPVYLT